MIRNSQPIRLSLSGVVPLLVGVTAGAHAATLSVPSTYATIQDAVDAAADGDVVMVADGVYPGDIDIINKSITVRSASDDPALCTIDGIALGLYISGVAVGDADVTVRGLTIRDCPTRGMSIEGNARVDVLNCVIEDCVGLGGMFMNARTLLLDGCVVRDNASGSNGAGLWISGGDVTIRNTNFRDNASSGGNPYGGGLYIGGDATVLIADSGFRHNTAVGTVSGFGGAIGIQGGSLEPVVIVNTVFDENEASDFGGGLYVEDRGAVVANATFLANVGLSGGGMYVDNAQASVSNSLLANNEAISGSGGGIRAEQNVELSLINATLFGNTATQTGGALYVATNSTARLANCILRQSGASTIGGVGTITATYSNIQGGYPGKGNIAVNAQFMDTAAGDFRLSPGSPCIDRGNTLEALGPAMDLDGLARVVDDPATDDYGLALANGAIDMGAFEFQPTDTCAADIDGNGSVDVSDLLTVLGLWGTCP